VDQPDLARRIAAALTERRQTVAVAEASAGGRLSAALTAVPGSSAWFLGAAIVYSSTAKEVLLGVGAAELASSGAVDPAAALLLARAVRDRLQATWGVAETGVAGPQGGRRSRKPAGLAYVAVVGPPGEAVREVLTGRDERETNQQAFAEGALALLGEMVEKGPLS
jgi:nicotinamide-nucleotide amidase